MQVHIEKILDLKRQLKEINSLDLEKIIWLKGGVAVKYHIQDVLDFKFTGLSNTDFIEYATEIRQ